MLLFQIRHSDQENNQTSTSKPASQEIIRAVPAFPLHHPSSASEKCSPPPPTPSPLLPPPSARGENLCPANTIPGMFHAPCILLYWQLLPVSQHKASYVRRRNNKVLLREPVMSIYIISTVFTFQFSEMIFPLQNGLGPRSLTLLELTKNHQQTASQPPALRDTRQAELNN